ncbi:MAG: SMC-Scp complex subunit ScpB [Clostridiales bacterium]|jgi:segregation and condensation protein B|nr:SMC-Scp complex subunit ScpB [Clostridiales bacterium]
MKLTKEQSAVESILFVAGEPVKEAVLAEAIGVSASEARAIVAGIKAKYTEERRGMDIVEVNGAYQMCTNIDNFEYIRKACGAAPKKPLSQTLMETLAIIAYNQPVTKARIENIRGVNADHAVNKLVELGLVTEKGRLDAPGKPILFGATDEFLKRFGLSSAAQLPPLERAL